MLGFRLFLVCSFPRFLHLFFLLLYQKRLHRVIVIVIVYQFRQIAFFLQHGPSRCFVLVTLVIGERLALFALEILPSNLELVLVFVIAHRVSRMIHAHQTPSDFCAAEIVHSKIGALLVFVLEPPKALGLARFLVAHELEEYGLAEL